MTGGFSTTRMVPTTAVILRTSLAKLSPMAALLWLLRRMGLRRRALSTRVMLVARLLMRILAVVGRSTLSATRTKGLVEW